MISVSELVPPHDRGAQLIHVFVGGPQLFSLWLLAWDHI
jgi:hypothetical protein